MNSRVCSWILALVISSAPLPAAAQCMGGTTGDHQHGTQQANQAGKESKKSAEKARRTATELLADPAGRDALLTAILSDPEFLRLLASRISEVPEWRALMREWSDVPAEPGRPLEAERDSTAGPTRTRSEGRPGATRSDKAVAYRCPMHSDVVADHPGRCPRCGMELEAVR